MKKRENFSSSLGVLMALLGTAVGLGNLWRFPYVAGQNGGAAYILVYIVFLIIFCLPLMLSEMIIGRKGQANVVDSFKNIAPKTKWQYTGYLSVLTAFVIISFYSVVGGWSIKYIVSSAINIFSQVGIEKDGYFSSFTGEVVQPIIYHLLFLSSVIFILLSGVKKGIEKYNKILTPILFIVVASLAIYGLTLSGAMEGVKFLIKPDFSKLTSKAILDALGQGLFSLSLGMGIVITYSSYIPKNVSLVKSAMQTIGLDLLFSIIAGFAIIPAVFAFGLEPNEGPGLLFVVLPKVFSQMAFGGIIAPIFFIALFFAAITSSVGLMEVIIAYLTESKKISRKKALAIAGTLVLITGILCSLSFGLLSDFKLFNLNIFDLFNDLSAIYFMPIGGLFISIFVGWKMEKQIVYTEFANGKNESLKIFKIFIFLLKYIVPVGIVIIFLNMIGII